MEGMESPHDRAVRLVEEMRGQKFERGQQPADPELILRIAQLLEAKGGADSLAERGFQEVADDINKYYAVSGKSNQPATGSEIRSTYEDFIKKVA